MVNEGKVGRVFRTKKQAERWPEPVVEPVEEVWGEVMAWEPGPIEEDRPSRNGPLAPEVLEDSKERYCGLPSCDSKAMSGSLFCSYHQKSALGETGARELRALNREMERLSKIADRDERKLAIAKFRSRIESGNFAILFARKTQETLLQAADEIVLDMELGALRLSLARALAEIEDPKELSLAVSRLSNAAVRASFANVELRKERRREQR